METKDNKQISKALGTLSEQLRTSASKQGMNVNMGKKIYRSKEELMADFSPNNMARYCVNRARCVTGTAPRLSEVADQFGKDAALDWLVPHLAYLVKSLRCKEVPTREEYGDMALMIFGKYSHLKLTEIMLFVNDYGNGDCGEFFGNVGRREVNGAIKDFVGRVRPRIISEWDKEQRRLEEQEAASPRPVGAKALAKYYAEKMLGNDFGSKYGREARKVWEKIKNGDFRGELGNYAENIDYYFRNGLVRYFADKIMRNDYVGRGGLMARKMSGMIETGDFTDDALGYIGKRVDSYLKEMPWQPQRPETPEENDGRDEDEIIEDYAERITRGNFTGKEGENARRVFEMLGTDHFTDDWLGGIARKVGERMAESFAPTYADRIRKHDNLEKKGDKWRSMDCYIGEIGERAKDIAERIKNGNFSAHWFFGEVERKVRDCLEARDSKPSVESDGAQDAQLFETREDAPF